MRPADRADHIVGVIHAGHPVAEGLVHGVFQRPGAGCHRHHGCAQLLHPEDVGPLPHDIFLAHIDGAFKAEPGCHSGGRHPVLAGAGLGNDPFFPHPPDQKPLAHDVVRLMGAGMVQILALDEYLCAVETT